MLEYIIELISDGKEVFLFGHSFGGLIINKMCEKIQEYIKNEEKTDEKKGFLENYEKKLIVATFGSIYLPNKNTLDSININNYMHIRDIAIRLNHIRIIFDGGVPKHSDLDNNFLCKRIDKGTDKERDIIIFKYNNIDPKKRVIFFNKYNDIGPITEKKINIIKYSKKEMEHHKNYTNLMDWLLVFYTNNLQTIKDKIGKCLFDDYPSLYKFSGGKSRKNKKSRKSKKLNKTRKTRK